MQVSPLQLMKEDDVMIATLVDEFDQQAKETENRARKARRRRG